MPGIGKVAVRKGKVEPLVVAAVKDKQAVKRRRRRGAGRRRTRSISPPPRRCWNPLPTSGSASPWLWWPAATRRPCPRSIDCFKDLPAEKTWPAEELLLRIASAQAPQVSLGNDGPAREKCHAAWMAWWKEHGKTIDLAKVDFSNTSLGYTVIVYQNQPVAGKAFRAGSWVMELDAAKNVRWKFEVPNFCMDAVVISWTAS